MIVLHLDPVLARLGPVTLTWHGLFSALGLLTGLRLALRLAERQGLDPERLGRVALWGVVGGLVGARLLHILDQAGFYLAHPAQILALTEGGFAIYGGILGGLVGGLLAARRVGLPAWPLLDSAAVGLVLGQGVGRIGDLINGEHHGRPSTLPWSVVYTHPNTLGEPGRAVHPAVAYEMVWDLVIFGLLWALARRPGGRPAGLLFWLYTALYGAGRLATGFFRQDAPLTAGLSQAQWLGLAGLVTGGLALLARAARPDRVRTPGGDRC